MFLLKYSFTQPPAVWISRSEEIQRVCDALRKYHDGCRLDYDAFLRFLMESSPFLGNHSSIQNRAGKRRSGRCTNVSRSTGAC